MVRDSKKVVEKDQIIQMNANATTSMAAMTPPSPGLRQGDPSPDPSVQNYGLNSNSPEPQGKMQNTCLTRW